MPDPKILFLCFYLKKGCSSFQQADQDDLAMIFPAFLARNMEKNIYGK
jgi:hypothetical protein